MGFFDFLKPKGVDEQTFNSASFQQEVTAFALWKHSAHDGNFSKVKDELLRMPDFRLSDKQADAIIDKLTQFLAAETNAQTHLGFEVAPGQIWTYRTRPGETDSRATVVKIDWMGSQQIIHIALNNLEIDNPNSGKPATEVGHLPVSKTAFKNSVVALEAQLPGVEIPEGYYQWKEVYDQGKAGVFDVSFSEIVDFIEQSMRNQ